MHCSTEDSGIAAVTGKLWSPGDPMPIRPSDRNPNQGWGKDYELFAVTEPNTGFPSLSRPSEHVVFHKFEKHKETN